MSQKLPPLRNNALCWASAVLAALVLLAVFGLYTDPDFMRLMADQVWACF